MEKIGIIGSAIVGQTLARGFKQHGYDVRIASRTPAKLAAFSSSSGITAGTFDDVAAWTDVGVLAVHGSAAEDALRTAGAANLQGKIVIDTSNPISDAPPVDGVIQYFTGPNDSLHERLQHAFPEVRLVKAFNSVGSAVAARAIEPLAQLWCIPGFRQNHWTHAFHVLWS
jgi:8-hydroxy-5-deazaflavin:NADPH oxidoreductase